MANPKREKVKRALGKDLLFISVMGIFAAVALVFILDSAFEGAHTEKRQDALQPFYTPPDPLPEGQPGDVLRKEPLDIEIPSGGKGYRILYLSERTDGSRVAASGMVFYPSGASPEGGRPVVAWAHPTTGMGVGCAPSRMDNPLSDMSWLEEMLSRGWVVTATDYTGLGTPGIEHYLIGRDEAMDVMNSVRAARWISDAKAGSSYAVWSHSQGGHAALYTDILSGTYAPELNLVAVAAAAPALELGALVNEQYHSDVGWVIGPEMLVAWPDVYHNLSIEDVATNSGLRRYKDLANDCVAVAGANAFIRSELKMNFFKANPVTIPSWYDAISKETPVISATSKPLFIAQGLNDEVVIPDTTALFVQKSCLAGVDVTTLWLGGTNHQDAARVAGPAAIVWLERRFRNLPTQPTCDQPLPVKPAEPPEPPTGT